MDLDGTLTWLFYSRP